MEQTVMKDQLPSGFEALPVYRPGESITGAKEGILAPHGIRAYRHTSSAVRVVLFDAPGPLVSATMVVNTQPISDAGHPHTLEHIIFLGSRNHPRRGYLDNLACRCLADGTNAWTDNEFTAYTTTTAGLDGMLLLLPVYLDHVMRPVINAAAFASEVYHVRADGKEAGVVYCEMQARENSESDLTDRALRSAILPNTPLALESSGLCSSIRTLTNDGIANFHRDQYCGANVTVVIGGSKIPANALLSSVQGLLDDIAATPGYNPGKPQWFHPLDIVPLPPITKKTVPFPCPDESIGTILMAWRGPPATKRIENVALDIFMRYLCNDVWSPLRQMFVEVEEQKASDIFYFQEPFFELSTFGISFSGVEHKDDDEGDSDEEGEEGEDVAMENGDAADDASDDGDTDAKDNDDSYLLSGKLQDEVLGFFKKVADSGELPGGIEAIHVAIKKDRENYLAQLESGTHEAVPYHLMEEIVYAHRNSLVLGEEARGSLAVYQALQEKDLCFWLDLLRTSIVDSSRVEVISVPDAVLAEKHAEEERKGVSERVERIGKETLEELGKENESRIASLKPAKFTKKDFPSIPSTSNISRWPYVVNREKVPGYIFQSVTLETEFVHCTILLDTKSLSLQQRMLIPVLCELITTCDILLEDGCYVSYTDNARALSEASVTTDHSGVFLGYGNNMAHQCVIIHFAAQPDSFAEAADLILQTMFQSEVTAERLSSISQTLMASSTADMRDGPSVIGAAVALMPFVEGKADVELPNFVLANLIGANPLISFLNDEFTRNKPRKQLRRSILRRLHDTLGELRTLPASDVFVQIAGRDPVPAQKTMSALWAEKRKTFAPDAKPSAPASGNLNDPASLPIARRIVSTQSKMFDGRNVDRIIGISGVESCFLEVVVDSPVYAAHADWASLRVLTEMLGRMEGPLCNAVRGTGLSYGVNLYNSGWTGHLVLSIEESSSPAAAWDAACNVLKEFREQLGKGNGSGLAVDLDTAKAAALFFLHRARSTPEFISLGCMSRTAIGAPASPLADQAVEEAVENVSLSALTRTFDKHIARLYQQPKGRMAVLTCGQDVVKDTIEAFKKCEWALGFEERTIESLYPAEVQRFVKSLK